MNNALTRCGTVKKAVTGTRMVEVVSGDEPANDELAPEVWPMPAGGPITSFRELDEQINREVVRPIVRGKEPTHRCLLCGTQYFSPGECDWCPVQRTPIQRGPLSQEQLAQGDLENHHLKVSGELERRRDHSALQLQADMPKWGL